MIFINTRPAARALPITNALESHGIKVLELPLLEMIPIKLDILDKKKLDNLLSNKYDVLIVVSPTAAELGYKALRSISFLNNANISSLINCPIVVVGEATAQILNKYNINTIIPSISNNEGMLNIDYIKYLNKDNRVMIWRGTGGRRLLIDSLINRGTRVDIVELYKRRLPPNTINFYNKYLEAIPRNSEDIAQVLITSAESFSHWKTLIAQGALISDHPLSLSNFHYLILGNRLSSILMKHNLSYQKIENLKIQTILNYYGLQP